MRLYEQHGLVDTTTHLRMRVKYSFSVGVSSFLSLFVSKLGSGYLLKEHKGQLEIIDVCIMGNQTFCKFEIEWTPTVCYKLHTLVHPISPGYRFEYF